LSDDTPSISQAKSSCQLLIPPQEYMVYYLLSYSEVSQAILQYLGSISLIQEQKSSCMFELPHQKSQCNWNIPALNIYHCQQD